MSGGALADVAGVAPYRSQPERQIAALLDRYGLPFIYEKPTAVVDGGKSRIWYPDFTLAYGILVEYFGVNGEPAYADRTRHKLRVYEENQMSVVAMYPHDVLGDWHGRFLSRVETTLESRLADYRARVYAPPRAHPAYRRSSY
jgi:hypothetical protein